MRYILTITLKLTGKNKTVSQQSQFIYDSEEELREANKMFDDALKLGKRNVNYSVMTTEAKIVIE